MNTPTPQDWRNWQGRVSNKDRAIEEEMNKEERESPEDNVCIVCGKPQKGRDWIFQKSNKGNTDKNWYHQGCLT